MNEKMNVCDVVLNIHSFIHSQDWLNRMKLISDRTIPTILASGKNILVDVMIITNQWSTTGLSKAVVCTVLSMEKCI